MATNSVQKFDSLKDQHEFIFAVVYRGHWCPFCMSWIKSFATLEDPITSAGGAVVIITAQTEDRLADVRKASGYNGPAINDPKNELVAELNKRYNLGVAISEKAGYEHGMAQPAILALKNDGTVLEHWAIVPGLMNLGGAKDRPQLQQVWQNVEAELQAKAAIHKRYATAGAMKILGEKIFGS